MKKSSFQEPESAANQPFWSKCSGSFFFFRNFHFFLEFPDSALFCACRQSIVKIAVRNLIQVNILLNEFRILHSNGFTEDEINEKKAIIYNNTTASMCTILRAMDNVLHIRLNDSSLEVRGFLKLFYFPSLTLRLFRG